MPEKLPAFQTPSNLGDVAGQRHVVARFKLTTAVSNSEITYAPGTALAANVWKAKQVDNQNATGPIEQMVLLATGGRQADQIVTAAATLGGAGAVHTAAGVKRVIKWIEVVGGLSVSYCKAMADWQPDTVNPNGFSQALTVSVKQCDAIGTLIPGAVAFPIYVTGNITRGTAYAAIKLNDVLLYAPLPNNGVASGVVVGTLPIVAGALHSLYQVVGTNAMGFDFVRSTWNI